MKSKESHPIDILPHECLLCVKNKKYKTRRTPTALLASVNPATYKGWSCQLYVVWMHCAN